MTLNKLLPLSLSILSILALMFVASLAHAQYDYGSSPAPTPSTQSAPSTQSTPAPANQSTPVTPAPSDSNTSQPATQSQPVPAVLPAFTEDPGIPSTGVADVNLTNVLMIVTASALAISGLVLARPASTAKRGER